MKLNSFISLVACTLLLTSCSEAISVFVKIFGLESASEKLEMRFDFKRFVETENVSVTNIKIYGNDTLLYELESDTATVTTWMFPRLPNGFSIKYPANAHSIRDFQKSEKLRFEFEGIGRYAAFGSWQYKPMFSSKEYRWLFDETGNKKINIDSYYEPWLGKDIIRITSNRDFPVDANTFQLYDTNMNPVDFEVKTKKELTNRVALILKNSFRKGEVLFLSFKAHNGETYAEKITVPDKSTVGIAGKFND